MDNQILVRLDALREQIAAMADAFNAQIRSMLESINSNNVNYQQRMTSLEEWRENHDRNCDASHLRGSEDREHLRAEAKEQKAFVAGQIAELAHDLGAQQASIAALEKSNEKHKGELEAAERHWKFWAKIGGLATLWLAVNQIWHNLLSGGKP